MTDIIYETVIDDLLIDAEYALDRLRQQRNFYPKWSEYQPMSSIIQGTAVHGVYKILYLPENKVYYIGQGKVGSRKAAHKSIFRHGGNPGDVGELMRNKDSDINNWHFSFCDAHEKRIASSYEARLISLESPPFNSQHMAGVS